MSRLTLTDRKAAVSPSLVVLSHGLFDRVPMKSRLRSDYFAASEVFIILDWVRSLGNNF